VAVCGNNGRSILLQAVTFVEEAGKFATVKKI